MPPFIQHSCPKSSGPKKELTLSRKRGSLTAMPQLSFHSPLGALTLSEEEEQIVSLDEGWGRDQSETPLLLKVRDMMQDYFDGEPVDFQSIPLMLDGTAYQKRVWAALRAIPHGQTRTYGDLAKTVGGSPQSIGQAVARNPLLILIPCHRVLPSHGRGHGDYSGFEGAESKAFLLGLEQEASSS